MSDGTLVERIGDWLIDQALGSPPISATFENFCARLQAIGIPVARARLTWPTLHPLFRAETVLWRDGREAEFQQFNHQESESAAWTESPIKWMLEHDVNVIRRRLTGPEPLLDFTVLKEIAEDGYTDFVAIRTPLTDGPTMLAGGQANFGIYVTWTTFRASGFSDTDIDILQRLQRSFAVACKTAIQPRKTANITNTYLGPTVASQVLAGHIQLGSGSRTLALVWYSDLRNSTHYSETLDETSYLALLNDYFGCVAHAAIEAGGEVLAFIGDAVLAIFPIKTEPSAPCGDVVAVVEAATRAARSAHEAGRLVNVARAEQGLQAIRFGIAMNIGDVMFGNIGIARRLSFSVIGATVNEVARIEKMTKTLGAEILATRAVAQGDAKAWRSIGEHPLVGLEDPMELFVLRSAAELEEPGEPRLVSPVLT